MNHTPVIASALTFSLGEGRGRRSIFLKLDCRVAALLAMTLLLSLTACAHQADLKTPSQIVKDEAKAKEKEASAARRAVKRSERDARRARDMAKNPPAANQESEEVTVPESNQ